jgi:hypothetical protein
MSSRSKIQSPVSCSQSPAVLVPRAPPTPSRLAMFGVSRQRSRAIPSSHYYYYYFYYYYSLCPGFFSRSRPLFRAHIESPDFSATLLSSLFGHAVVPSLSSILFFLFFVCLFVCLFISLIGTGPNEPQPLTKRMIRLSAFLSGLLSFNRDDSLMTGSLKFLNYSVQ